MPAPCSIPAGSTRPRNSFLAFPSAADPRWGERLKFIARMIAGPSADQGLLIARDHYDRLGGYAPDTPRSEARLLRQLGRSPRTQLRRRINVAQARTFG